MPQAIVKAYIRHYRDNGQTVAHVEWADGSTTCANLHKNPSLRVPLPKFQFERLTAADFGTHMDALLRRAERDGLKITKEIW